MIGEEKIAMRLRKQNLSIMDFVFRFVVLSIPIGIQAFLLNLGLIATARYIDLERFSSPYYVVTYAMLIAFLIIQYTNAFKIILGSGAKTKNEQ